MKTNKSFTKRLRVTKKGKIIARAPGQNHFNSRKNGRARQQDRRQTQVKFSVQEVNRFLPNH